MTTRIVFGAELRYAIHVRGLTLTDVALRSGVAVATASAASKGRPVNVGTAVRLARSVAACPIVPELLAWVERPAAESLRPSNAWEATDAVQATADGAAEPRPMQRESTQRTSRRRTSTNAGGQPRISLD